MKSKCLILIALIQALWGLPSCSSTKVVNSYASPTSSTVVKQAKKIIVACFMQDEASRRNMEDAIATSIGPNAVPSHTVMDMSTTNMSEDDTKQFIQQNGFDLAVVSRLVSVDKSLDYVPGDYATMPPFYGSFYGYWDMAYDNFYTPGYYTTDKTYKVETNIYDLKAQKLEYSAITETYDPSDFDSASQDIIKAVKNDLKKNNIIN